MRRNLFFFHFYHSFKSGESFKKQHFQLEVFRFGFFTFLVGAFSFKEKSPTITVASFFFVRPQSSSRMYHFLQKLISSLRPSSTNANLLQRVPPFVFHLFYVTYKTGRLQRVPLFNFFSALCEFFFRNFLMSQKSPPFGFFDILQQIMLMNPKGSPLFIFWHCATFSKFFFKKKIFRKIFNFFCFQSGKVIFQSYRA